MELLKCALFLASLIAVRAVEEDRLELLPTGKEISQPVGTSFGLSCKALVSNPNLLQNFRWLDPRKQPIDENYSKVNSRFTVKSPVPGQLALIINQMSENDVGQYTCTAEYNQKTLSSTKGLKIFRPIKWIDANTEQSAKLGSMYQIKCKVEADPSPQVAWSRDNIKLNTNNPRFTFDLDGLTINGVTEADDGIYTCEVFVPDTGEFQYRTIKFEVISKPKVVAIEPAAKVDVVEGEAASIRCNATGKPKPTIQWINSRDGSVLSTVVDGRLYFEHIAKKDGGQYKCVAVNKAGQDDNNVTVNVVSKPEIVESVNATILVGRNGKLQCYVEGYPTPKVSIVKQGLQGSEAKDMASRTIVKEDPKKRPNTVVATLNLNNVQRAMDGLYECIAVNQVGEKEVKTISNLHTTVEFQPTFEKTGFVKEQITWGNRPVNLTCVAEAIPNASIEWFRGPSTNKIVLSSEYKIVGQGPRSDLQVTPLNKDVYAPYRCKATNPHGEAFHTITLKEAFPPNAVADPQTAEVTASSVTFRLTDTYNGGLPIKGYKVHYIKEGTTDGWKNAKEHLWPAAGPFVLRDLMPLAKYTFRFLAFNDAGAGPWGGTINVNLPEISSPSEPVITNPVEPNEKYVKSSSANQIHLKWTIPSANGADIDKYFVKICTAQPDQNSPDGFYVPNDSCQTQEISYNNFLSAYTIENLNSKSYYRVELVARNNIGSSPPSSRFFLTSDNVEGEKMANTGMTSATIIYIVVAFLIAFFVVIDIFCFFVNNTGVISSLCRLCCGKKKKNDDKLGSESKDLISNGHKKIDIEEQSPMITDGSKKDTAVEYDLKKGTSKTGFVGKDSAV